jgi:hypothetical protein
MPGTCGKLRMDEDDRQLREIHDRERWDADTWLERTCRKMESDVERGTALQRILRAERLAANRDINEQELNHVTHSER